MNQQEIWDAESAMDFRAKIHALAQEIYRLRDEEAVIKARYRATVERRKKQQAELEAAIQADGEKLPLEEYAQRRPLSKRRRLFAN